MNKTHEYIAKGPDLYMRQFHADGDRDCWLAIYPSDDAAKDAAVRWNERAEEFKAAQDCNQQNENV